MLGAVPWQINVRVLDAVEAAWRGGGNIAKLPTRALGDPLPDLAVPSFYQTVRTPHQLQFMVRSAGHFSPSPLPPPAGRQRSGSCCRCHYSCPPLPICHWSIYLLFPGILLVVHTHWLLQSKLYICDNLVARMALRLALVGGGSR